MSQAKVDRYKKEKADRKKTMRKEKIMRNVKRCVAGVIVLAIVGWFGYSAAFFQSGTCSCRSEL